VCVETVDVRRVCTRCRPHHTLWCNLWDPESARSPGTARAAACCAARRAARASAWRARGAAARGGGAGGGAHRTAGTLPTLLSLDTATILGFEIITGVKKPWNTRSLHFPTRGLQRAKCVSK
jgi:hypothetical protein